MKESWKKNAFNPENRPARERIVTYVGGDEQFWRGIQKIYLDTYPAISFTFHKYYSDNEIEYKEIFLILLKSPSDIIYIDFAKNPLWSLKLAKAIIRDPKTMCSTIVGLFDYLQMDSQVINECMLAGIPILHIKSGAEMHDVVYHPMAYRTPQNAADPGFAVARLQKEVKAKLPTRVSYVTDNYIRIECNQVFENQEEIILDQSIFKPKDMPSRRFQVKKIGKQNLYYNNDFYYHLGYYFNPEDFKGKESFDAQECLKNVKHWVVDHINPSAENKVKILFIDTDYKMFVSPPAGWEKQPFGTRFLANTEWLDELLYQYLPDIIVFEFDRDKELADEESESNEEMVKEETSKNAKYVANDLAGLDQLMSSVLKIERYRPYIMLYKCGDDSKSFNERYKYPQMIINQHELKGNEVAEVAHKLDKARSEAIKGKLKEKLQEFKKKDPTKFRSMTVDDLVEKKCIFKHTDSRSIAHIEKEVDIKVITESEMIFLCDSKMAMGTVLLFEDPLTFKATIIPHKPKSPMGTKQGCYRAAIHTVSEDQKQELRRFVNSIFFADLEEKKKKELEEFKLKNLSAMKMKEADEDENSENPSSSDQEKKTGSQN